MNKFLWMLSASLLTGCVILYFKIVRHDESEYSEFLSVHINTLDRAAGQYQRDIKQYYDYGLQRMDRAHPEVVRGISNMRKIISFEDSANFYFDRMSKFSDVPDSARACFIKYTDFSSRFIRAVNDLSPRKFNERNYLLNVSEKLPGRELPFGSPQGVHLLSALMRLVL